MNTAQPTLTKHEGNYGEYVTDANGNTLASRHWTVAGVGKRHDADGKWRTYRGELCSPEESAAYHALRGRVSL